ncbi:MAG: reverse transcriptase-like protein [Nitrososphaerota archaeon]|jgi:ribonuclease HI/catechol 2,3-dioxygenase-like lactoylglutathione lyase family enzyme|nr:reverse transcriptase-like protein [Nitrososphaerota archaeon]
MSPKLMLYSDGGARGNPGPAAAAYIALNETGVTVKTDARSLGTSTNNQAEYAALLMALQFAAESGTEEVICYLDSELVVKQLTGEYAVKNLALQKLWHQVQKLRGEFKNISFQNVRRSNPCIARADALVNQVLDAQRQPTPTSFSLCNKTQPALFVHACIRTSNLERSVDFYSRFLGLEVKNRLEIKKTNAEIVFLQNPQHKGCALEIVFYRNQPKQQQQLPSPSVDCYANHIFDHLCFEVADIQKTLAAMKEASLPLSITDVSCRFNETPSSSSVIVFVKDPDGTPIELVECDHGGYS